jgi:hypothetical protein
LRAGFASWASGIQMGGGAEGMGWQADTSGTQTGYEDLGDIGRQLGQLVDGVKGQFTPLSGAYQ